MSRALSFCLALWMVSIFGGCNGEANPEKPIIQEEIPVDGDYVRIHLPSEPDNLNPFLTTIAHATFVKEYMYQYLLTINPESRELVPQLAKGMPEVSADGLSFTMEINEKARWDNGDPITVEDYLFSLKVIFNRNLPLSYVSTQYDFLEDVIPDPTNPRRFTITTKEPNFRSEFSVGGFEVLSHQFYDPDGLMKNFTFKEIKEDEGVSNQPGMITFAAKFQEDKYGRDPAFLYGSGPYKLEKWEPGISVTLVRKENYWGDGLDESCWCHSNYPEKIIFQIINDPEAANLALKNGELDFMKEIPSEKFIEYKEEGNIISQQYNLYTPKTESYTFIGLNCRPTPNRAPLFVDKRVRRAFAHLVDVETIIEDVYLGFGERCVGPVLPKTKESNDTLKPIMLDLNRAKQLLSEAGWEDTDGDGVRDKMINGKKVSFKARFLVPKGSGPGMKLASLVAQMTKEAGMEIEVVEKPTKEISEQLYQHDYDLFGLGFSLPPLLPDFKQTYHSSQWESHGTNFFGFGTPESDSLIEAIRSELDPAKRKPMYDRFQEILYDEQPMVFLRNPLDKIAVAKRFKNVSVTSVRPGISPNCWWVPKAEQRFPVAQ